ncbi:hypothetical protein CF319_g4905 [Tilletia indica]|nr:hypothetical protein CF319_g4905 [Tilletia indica]
MVKVLVTGASGLLGRAVLARCQKDGFDVKGLAFSRASGDLEKIDLTDEAATEALVRSFQPDAIIHTAAERRPDVVEKNPDASRALNVDVPAHLARLSAELDPAPLLINISTDYVFDGTKPPYHVDDAPNPLNAYGVSKLEGEMAVTKYGKPGSSTSVRVPVLYGRTAPGQNDESAVNVLLDAVRPPSDPTKKKKMDAYAVRYPTNVEDVARVLADLVKTYTSSLTTEAPMNVPGILHFSATEAMSKYDMSMIFTRLTNALGGQASADHLEPEYEIDPLAATSRPRHCKLDVSVLKGLGVNTECVSFEDWWRGYIDELETLRREEEERKRMEEEARRKKQEEEEAERRRKEEEEAAERRRKEEEEAAARRKKEEEEAAELRKREEEEAAQRRLKEEEAAAVERKRKEEEEAAAEAERQRQAAEDEARRQEEEAGAAAAAAEERRLQQAREEEKAQQPKQTEEQGAARTQSSESAMTTRSTESIPSLAKDGFPSQMISQPAESNSAEEEGRNRTARQDSNGSTGQYRVSAVASPDPSLSSLRPLRPTPPVTLTSREGSILADEGDISSSSQNIETTPSDSAITAVPPHSERGLPSRPDAEPQKSPSAQAGQRQQLPPDAPGFFPVSLALNQADAIGGVSAPLNLRADGRTGMGGDPSGNDADSDGYGEPSPRVTALHAPDEIDGQDGGAAGGGGGLGGESRNGLPGSGPAPSHFKAGYGEVPFAPGQRPRASGTQDASWTGEGQEQRAVTDANAGSRSVSLAASAAPPKLLFEIRVGDPQKVGDPVTAHIVYTVRTKTTATFFRAQTFSVLRRYSDFRWLHAAMVANNPGTFVPPVPEKVKIGRFAPDLVEARRHGLETCINKIAAHPILQKDEDFKLFLESVNFNADVKLRDMRKGPVPTPEQRTYFGWQSSLNGPKFHETDDWFDHQKAYLDGLEGQLKQVVKAFSLLANQRRELAHAVSEYSLMLTNLSGSSLSRSMSTCFAGLGELEKRVQELNCVQSDADVRVIGSVIYEYERLVGSIRKAFATRVDAWIAWYKSDEETRKVQAKHEKFKKDHRGTGGSHMEHRLQLSLQDVADSESRALTLKRDFDAVTARCKEEMSRFEREKVEDLRRALVRWLDGLIERQEEVVREWELFSALLTRQTGINPDPDAVLPPPPVPAAPAPAQAAITPPTDGAAADSSEPEAPRQGQQTGEEGASSGGAGVDAEEKEASGNASATGEPTIAPAEVVDETKDVDASEPAPASNEIEDIDASEPAPAPTETKDDASAASPAAATAAPEQEAEGEKATEGETTREENDEKKTGEGAESQKTTTTTVESVGDDTVDTDVSAEVKVQEE